MASDVNTYLEELQAELAGADPALAQDALYDAEEYLRAELAALPEQTGDQAPDSTGAMAAVIERYGTPREVAAAYLASEAGPAPARSEVETTPATATGPAAATTTP